MVQFQRYALCGVIMYAYGAKHWLSTSVRQHECLTHIMVRNNPTPRGHDKSREGNASGPAIVMATMIQIPPSPRRILISDRIIRSPFLETKIRAFFSCSEDKNSYK
ncbi:hypothetical protein AAG906_010112 [Vitis piasezkii]